MFAETELNTLKLFEIAISIIRMKVEEDPWALAPERKKDFSVEGSLLLYQAYLNADDECQKLCLLDQILRHEEETGAEGRCYGRCCYTAD